MAGAVTRTHGLSETPEYAAWYNMLYRCRSEKHNSHKNYGARGIAVCERWKVSFTAFLEDMGAKPSPELTLDRIDNNQGYEPLNCRWATRQEQLANRRLYKGGVDIDGEVMSLKDAMERYGIEHRSTVAYRMKTKGWSLPEAIKTPSLRAEG